MNCKSCGNVIKAGAKFCGGCGAKVDSTSDTQGLVFAPNPLGLDNCEIKILEVKGEGPDSDGDIRIEIKCEVTNKSDEDWDYFVARTQVLNANGLPLEETRDTYEQSIAAGDTGEFETYLGSIKFKTLGVKPDRTKVLVSLVACGTRIQKLGGFDVPANPFEMLPLPPVELGDTLRMVSGNLWRTSPDSDNDSTVNVKTLIQNLTPMHLHEVSVIAEITDKSGRDITNANGSEEVRPGDICVISGAGYGKDKQLKGAAVSLTLRACTPLATGLCQHSGLEVIATDVSESEYASDENAIIQIGYVDFSRTKNASVVTWNTGMPEIDSCTPFIKLIRCDDGDDYQFLSFEAGEIDDVVIDGFEAVRDESSDSDYFLCYTATFSMPNFKNNDLFKAALESSGNIVQVIIGFKDCDDNILEDCYEEVSDGEVELEFN